MRKLRSRFAADDWGISPGVNEAILELAERGLLRSVSLFAHLPHTEYLLRRLQATGVELAAHCCFTLGRPLTGAQSLRERSGKFHSFGRFLLLGLAGRLDAEEVRAETAAQLDRLRALAPIVSLNGHQNVHLLPWMAAPLASAAAERGIRRVRFLDDSAHWPSRLAGFWGRRAWERAGTGCVLEPTHYLYPTGFWSKEQVFHKVERAESRSLLVHPAVRDDFAQMEFSDGLRAARVKEYRSLLELAP
jgi:predicted glycoside hydrolase/deacetylase ChbG (UPF0249 family)